MSHFSHYDMTTLLLAIALLLGLARLLGEAAIRLGQPAVVGELAAGVILGPTVLGAMAPGLQASIFPVAGPVPVALEGLVSVAIILFLLVAGMEVDLSIVWREGKTAASVAVLGMVVPFGLGLGAALSFPRALNWDPAVDQFTFALFFATALSISALPVIAKILMDLHLFRSDLGMTVISAAIFNDLLGWIIFALVLSRLGLGHQPMNFALTVLLLLLFAGAILTLGRAALDRMIPWIQARTSWPAGILGFAFTGALLAAAFTEWIGVHAIFGAFLFGVALGDSSHLREHTRATVEQFISFIFAPLFFASVGLRVDFAQNFDLGLCVLVFVLACLGKIFACTFGAWRSGLGGRQAWATGFLMNARGAMEIVLGVLALSAGVIQEPLFVALVVMALLTSIMGGTGAKLILQVKKPRRFIDFSASKTFVPHLLAGDARTAIEELAGSAAQAAGLDAAQLADAVWRREQLMSTSLGNGLAVPHARLRELKTPLVAVGLSENGIDFDAVDGLPTHVVFLILTPEEDHESQIQILADIARTFQNPEVAERAAHTTTYTEFLSLVRTEV